MGLFSTYSTGENRVTASILAVLRSIALPRAERLIGALIEQPDFELIRFENQPAKGGEGVPDAAITGSVRLLIETKVGRNSVRTDQLRRHLARLDTSGEAVKRLLLLTPDDGEPGNIGTIEDDRLAWSSFARFDQAIDELLADKTEVISEREAFLLRELQSMFAEERLLTSADDVVVVAARRAWDWYNRFHAYLCQPGRTFKPAKRMAFYSNGQIYPLVPAILEVKDHVPMRVGENDGEIGRIVDLVVNQEPGRNEPTQKVFRLSAPEDPSTARLATVVRNDITTESGRPWAFTLGQRYVSMARLAKATKTSELVEDR